MPKTNLRRGWSGCLGRGAQKGQALVYGVFVLAGSLAALFFLFNTGQLAREKTKLVTTTDAVAYSAGVMQARALNFDAYNNRALLANEILVAQMVSLSSWATYASTHAGNIPSVFTECSNYYSAAAASAALFGPEYAGKCFITYYYGSYIQEVADLVPTALEYLLFAVEANKTAILAAQGYLHFPLYFQKIRGDVMQEVADSNYTGDGLVTVEPANALTIAAVTMNDDWRTFTKKYSGDERTRFAEVAKISAYKDQFVQSRNWNARADLPEPGCLSIFKLRYNEVRKRGGTELINFDEWKAEDTESLHQYYLNIRRRFRVIIGMSCDETERVVGYGEQQAYDSDQDESGAYLGGSPSTNPRAHSYASSSAWTNYTGIPSYYELTDTWLASEDPRMAFGVRLVRAKSQLRTSDASSQIKAGPGSRINAYNSNVASDEMVAVTTAETYFERPSVLGPPPAPQNDNSYGASRGTPLEIGSLFNPYWQVRLIYSDLDVRGQQLRQGALLP